MENKDIKCRSGYRVVGPTFCEGMGPGELHCWYFPTLESANEFAKFTCERSGCDYEVHKYIGSWERRPIPVEFIEANDLTKDSTLKQ